MSKEQEPVRTGFYVDKELLNRADEAIGKTNARSRSEFISDALEFYIAWLHSEETSKVLTPALESVIGAKIKDTENRIARVLFKQSVGCEENEEEAQRWFSMALEVFRNAEQAAKKPGYLRYRIGKCYAYGHGAEQNYEESARWFQRAVAENNPFAAYSLGGQYLRGQGVEQSNTEGYKLFIMAANHGNAYAQYQLGRMCKDGIGTEVDLEESQLWYAKAYAGFLRMEETMADDKLHYRLGSMNMTGNGTAVDLEQAEMYFQKAVELRYPAPVLRRPFPETDAGAHHPEPCPVGEKLRQRGCGNYGG